MAFIYKNNTLFIQLLLERRTRKRKEMMKKKREVMIFFFTLVLLVSMASRVISREDGFAPPKPSPSAHEKARNSKGDGVGVLECKNLDSEEECLVKKAVAAHTDYIYTQDLNLSP